MSLDVDSRGETEELELRTGEALAHVLATASVAFEFLGEDLELEDTVRRYVDRWIAELVPLDYVDGMAEVVGEQLNAKPWEVFENVSEDELSLALEYAVQFKRRLNSGALMIGAEDLEVRVERILRSMGVKTEELYRFENSTDPSSRTKVLVTALALAFGISSVRGRSWAQE
ncbi:hypothetical protein HS1genome_1311 [Sulfodiicoccus acidiphilus]|uniref:Uncharacterized protein n=1 Tax=Sulfodiicoccus acidiphilus TaxID=1670455 RepID=A0A348B420_9CREN|nr:hypothetical protein [Sulfodiicoccus acidiphilus]BBD72922.1 hypothetical protein HS1genome_1311 [Sulfodiicoccus acidiphilus]GGT87981.1 hypothetical protein GCM10007116_02410 [Sulfodiicoccus acidiphilus]